MAMINNKIQSETSNVINIVNDPQLCCFNFKFMFVFKMFRPPLGADTVLFKVRGVPSTSGSEHFVM